MSTNRFNCHHCGKHLTFRIDQFGKKIRCPKCNQPIQVGMRPKEEAAKGGFFKEKLRLLVASTLLIVAVAMIWYMFFS